MDFKTITPEQAGISSACVENFVKRLERHGLSTHDVILAKGDGIFFETYWAPFHENFQHRMYSVSKSVVSLAVGFCEQEGLLDLDLPISHYFPQEAKATTDENLKKQTIRHMLMMSTAKPANNWFLEKPSDRVLNYFQNKNKETRPSGTVYSYDSNGSFLLCALVERVTGMKFMDYLRPRLFDKIGVSKEAKCLACPGGHSWGDSGILCTARDMLKIARFTLNYGSWDGEQLLNEAYVKAATKKQIDNNANGIESFDTQGYGYQIWRTYYNGFFFNGMGCQFAACIPHLDLIFIYNGDNQGKMLAKNQIFEAFFQEIVEQMGEPLSENKAAEASLNAYCSGLKLAAQKGAAESGCKTEIEGVTYLCDENPMGLKWFRVEFCDNGGKFCYENARGEKEFSFGVCENAFGMFPEEGYADQVATEFVPGHYFKCAVSAAWIEEKKLQFKVQIIDEYFGNFTMTIGFRDDGKAGILMCKTAEDFLGEYNGFAGAKKELIK